MKALKLIALSVFFIAGTSSFAECSTAAKTLHGGKWEKLGSRVVKVKGDHDEIPVTAKDGVFTKLKLKVMKAPIRLLNINVIFGNGTHKNFVFNKRFAPGSSTRVLDLPGNKRIIKKVKLNYKTVPAGKGRAVVSLWGRH